MKDTVRVGGGNTGEDSKNDVMEGGGFNAVNGGNRFDASMASKVSKCSEYREAML